MTTNSSAHHANVNPSEVGWQFVPQYYTFVNKEPHRLHCFYSKTSTFVHGTEGEDVKPCLGQQEIHKKITSIGFEDCRVFIHSVDAQASANGGIIIQVIGEMSNHDDPWRKFVQTFFLAEQPNGYFVLNDIFRFLKEESVEADDASESAAPETVQDTDVVSEISVKPSLPVPAPEPVFEQPRETTPAPPAPAVVVELAPAVVSAEEVPQVDESSSEPTQTPTPAPEQHSPPVVAIPVSQPNGHVAEPEKVAAVSAEVPARPTPSPAPAPTQTTIPAQPQQPAAAAPQQPVAPSRSWASLAATNQKKWGAVAQDTKGVSEIVTPSSAPGSGTQTPAAPQTPTPSGGPHHHGRHQRNDPSALVAAQNVTTAHCFVKAVTEHVTQAALSQTLSRFGTIKDLDVVRQKACAFVEYNSVDTARKAIIASLNHNQGGEGGVFVDAGGEQVRIFVETKKEKGDRPPSRPHRGGAPGQQVNGSERGGPPQGGGNFRGRSGGQRGGRGGSQK